MLLDCPVYSLMCKVGIRLSVAYACVCVCVCVCGCVRVHK